MLSSICGKSTYNVDEAEKEFGHLDESESESLNNDPIEDDDMEEGSCEVSPAYSEFTLMTETLTSSTTSTLKRKIRPKNKCRKVFKKILILFLAYILGVVSVCAILGVLKPTSKKIFCKPFTEVPDEAPQYAFKPYKNDPACGITKYDASRFNHASRKHSFYGQHYAR